MKSLLMLFREFRPEASEEAGWNGAADGIKGFATDGFMYVGTNLGALRGSFGLRASRLRWESTEARLEVHSDGSALEGSKVNLLTENKSDWFSKWSLLWVSSLVYSSLLPQRSMESLRSPWSTMQLLNFLSFSPPS